MVRSHPVIFSGAFALGLSVAACAVPDADKSIAEATHVTGAPKPRIQGAQGPLTSEQSQALLAKIGADGDGDKILKRHLAVEEAVAGSPLTGDNAVTVLPDGAAAFHAMAQAIKNAKHTLNLEYYTVEDVDLDGDGKKLSDLLLEKRSEGVAINIIYDSYGSSDTPSAFFDRLKQAGVNLLDFHPISPTKPLQAIDFNDRDHRKILVADGAIGIVGGVNLSKSYESKFPGSGPEESAEKQQSSPVEGLTNTLGITTKLPDQWRDTAARIEGPAVGELQKLFVSHWVSEKGPPLDQAGFFPKLEARGDQVARIIGSTPDQPISRYYVTLISALRNAESKAWISAAYFVPTPDEVEALADAAKRGVDVRLLLPDVSDSQEAIEAAHSHYTDLLEAGVKIYETKDVVLHSKTVVIDGVWSAIGSSNFDHRSVLFNDEVDAIVLGSQTARALEAVFTQGEQIATVIDREQWEDSRPMTERVRGFFARMWENLL